MVKADLTRDYYGDLELPPNADANDIKRQFKKLALLYHPDRNPGRENEVTARFQRIQSAHEVLTDTHERAKYDSNRRSNIYRTGGNQRGNPWSNVSSQFPTPPKAPTRARPQQPPPPSAGAQRYKNFETPRHSANQSAQEGAEARRSTYEAWERMRERNPPGGQASSKPPPPPRKAASNATRPSPTARSHSQNSSQRKGFTPNTPGGDEPAAPRTAYATHREKPMHAPPPPSDTQPPSHERPTAEPSRRHSKTKTNVHFEPRMSTPYATHGGEKFNPFESLNMNRSKSTRVPSTKYSADGMPRVGSDPNLNAGQRPRPQSTNFGQPGATFATPSSDDSSSDSGPQIKKKATTRGTPVGSRTFAKARSFTGRTKPTPFRTSPIDPQATASGQPAGTNTSTQEPPPASNQPNPQQAPEPSMYDRPHDMPSTPRGKGSTHGERLPTVSEQVPSSPKDFSPSPRSLYLLSRGVLRSMWPESMPRLDDKKSVSPASGQALFPLEEAQRSVLDGLITERNSKETKAANESNASDVVSSCKSDSNGRSAQQSAPRTMSAAFTQYRDPHAIASPAKKQKPSHNGNTHISATYYHNVMSEVNANRGSPTRFSFNVDESTFSQTSAGGYKAPGSEPINTTFSPSEWESKFQSNHFFAPDQNAASAPKFSRQNSGTRTRGRSPTKSRSGEKPMHAHVEGESTESSPGGTKFSKDEWAKTFNPRTFMPPQASTGAAGSPNTKKSRVSSIKPTMGTAAVVDDGDTSDDKPLFKGRNATASEMSSAPTPDPMDVDTPSATSIPSAAEEPQIGGRGQNAAPDAGQAREDDSLKVDFDDLQIQDLISSLNLPTPPPAVPLPRSAEARKAYAVKFDTYMKDWDLFYSRMMLHFVSRKGQNETLSRTRWLNTDGISFYRKGLQEDGAVLKWWNEAVERHYENMKKCQVLQVGAEGAGQAAPAQQ